MLITGCQSKSEKALEKAIKLAKANNCVTALSLIGKHLEELADNPTAQEISGRCNKIQKEYQKAVQHYESAISLGIKPKKPEVFFSDYGTALLETKRYRKAEIVFRRALKLGQKEDMGETKCSLGTACARLGKVVCTSKHWPFCKNNEKILFAKALQKRFTGSDSDRGSAGINNMRSLPKLFENMVIHYGQLATLVENVKLVDGRENPFVFKESKIDPFSFPWVLISDQITWEKPADKKIVQVKLDPNSHITIPFGGSKILGVRLRYQYSKPMTVFVITNLNPSLQMLKPLGVSVGDEKAKPAIAFIAWPIGFEEYSGMLVFYATKVFRRMPPSDVDLAADITMSWDVAQSLTYVRILLAIMFANRKKVLDLTSGKTIPVDAWKKMGIWKGYGPKGYWPKKLQWWCQVGDKDIAQSLWNEPCPPFTATIARPESLKRKQRTSTKTRGRKRKIERRNIGGIKILR